MREKNLPPETLIEHWQFVQVERLGFFDTAILRIATTAYKSKAVCVYVYDGTKGSKEVSKEIPPQVMGRLVGETMTYLLRSGVWVKQPPQGDDNRGLTDEQLF